MIKVFGQISEDNKCLNHNTLFVIKQKITMSFKIETINKIKCEDSKEEKKYI